MKSNAEHARQYIDWTHEWMENEGDTPETGLAQPLLAIAYAQLALADELRATRQATHPERPAWDLDTETVAGTGHTNYYTQDGKPATTAQVRDYLDRKLSRHA